MMRHAFAPLTCLALLAACSSGEEREPAPVSYQGTQPSARPTAPAAPLTASGPDARGVVYNDGYETIIARDGDTVDTIAARVGISGAELAAYNGLPTTYQPQRGDELVLPGKPNGYRTNSVAAAQPALAPTSTVPAPTAIGTSAIGTAPPAPASGVATAPAAGTSGWSASSIAAAIDDTSSRESTLSAPSDPVAADPTATAAVPPVPSPAAPAPAAPVPAASAAAPQLEPTVEPVQPVVAPAAQVASAAPSSRFVTPVDAAIARPFSKLPGPNRNDGVDFASPAGLEVRAAEAGTVALVSKSLGGLGTIVLIRHDGGLLTVYGRIDSVAVKKGDAIARGQTFARVAKLPSPREPSLHFEVRRGAESVDPADFI